MTGFVLVMYIMGSQNKLEHHKCLAGSACGISRSSFWDIVQSLILRYWFLGWLILEIGKEEAGKSKGPY